MGRMGHVGRRIKLAALAVLGTALLAVIGVRSEGGPTPEEYIRPVLADEENVEFEFGEPIVDGDRAAIEWWAVVTENGKQVSLAGTSVVRFDENGRALEQTDYWGQTEGRTPPWDAWGRQRSTGSSPKAGG